MPTYRVGYSIDDRCVPCRLIRRHTIVAVAGDRVQVRCDYCASLHNYRGGTESSRDPLPVVSNREIVAAEGVEDVDAENLERLLRRVIREESGLTPVAPAEKWRGGQLVLRPGREGLQEKAWPIESFFQKIVMIRNRLRVLEQQINAADVPDELKVKLQGYVTGCYGTLTSFNVLFADEADRFRGSGGSD